MVHDQAAGFALDALDARDALEFERHLQRCPSCEDAVEPLRVAAAALAFAGDLPLPRPELRLRVVGVGGGVVVALRRRWSLPLLSASVLAAACAAIAVGTHAWTVDEPPPAAGLRSYPLQGRSSGSSASAGGVLFVAGNGDAVLITRGLQPTARGTVHELWVVRGGETLPAGFLRGQVGALGRPVPPGAAVAVSLEPVGGSRRPTGPVLLRAETA